MKGQRRLSVIQISSIFRTEIHHGNFFTNHRIYPGRYQTTVPVTVCKALNVGERDEIRSVVQPDGEVPLSRPGPGDYDLALDSFLTFLENDIKANPERLEAATHVLVSRIQSVTGEIEVDLDATLDPEDE